jgi:hypothetical protein
MAFKWMDDDAWEATNDGALNSGQAHRLRDNIEAISTERRHQASVKLPRANPFRACSIYPAALGPLWIYLSEEERWKTITVDVRYSDVTFENHAASGDDAVLICATLGGIGWWNHPPRDTQGWTTIAEGAVTHTALTVPVSSNVDPGWNCVYLWVWSIFDNNADAVTSKGAGLGMTELTLGGVDMGGAGLGAFTNPNPPERCIFYSSEYIATGTEVGYDNPGQILYQNPADADQIYVQPPILAPSTLGPGYDIRTCGVIHIEGVGVWATPEETQIVDIEPALRSGRRLGWYAAQPLAEHTERLASTRTRQYGCHVGIGQTAGNNANLWSIRSDVLGNGLTTSDQFIAQSGVILEPTDSNGYGVILSLILKAFIERNTSYTPQRPYERDIAIVWSLQSYTAGQTPGPGTLNATTSSTVIMQALPPLDSYENNTPQPIIQTTTAMEAGLDDWQYRGLLAFRRPVRRQGSDIDQLQTMTMELDETGIAYPMVLAVRARLDSAVNASTTLAVISRAFTSRRLLRYGE